MKKYLPLLMICLNVSLYSQSSYLNPIITDLGFLDLCSNSRIGAFGEISAVSSSFYNDAGLFQNPALISGNERYAGGNFSYMPWLRNIVDDINIKEINGYYSLDKKNSIGYDFKYFDLGETEFHDANGNLFKISDAKEFFHQITYAHSFNSKLAMGLGLKYIKSDYGSVGTISGYESKPVNTFALNLGTEYRSDFKISENSLLNYHIGGVISNFGPKIKHSSNPNEIKNFIPTTLRIGFLINPDFYLSDKFRLNFDFAYQADKYLTPTFPIRNDTMIIQGKNPNISPFQALYQSFYDAPNGTKEELHEITHKLGTEVRINYQNQFYFAIRLGKMMIDKSKGEGFNTKGFGCGIYGFTLDYKIIRTTSSGLDKTWAISLGFQTRLDKMFHF